MPTRTLETQPDRPQQPRSEGGSGRRRCVLGAAAAAVAAAELLMLGGHPVTAGLTAQAQLQATLTGATPPTPSPTCASDTVTITTGRHGPATPFTCSNSSSGPQEAVLTVTGTSPLTYGLHGFQLLIRGDATHISAPLAHRTYDLGAVPPGRSLHGNVSLQDSEAGHPHGITATFTVSLRP